MSSAAGVIGAAATMAGQSAGAAVQDVAGTTPPPTVPKAGKLAAFEGFLKKAGHVAGVVLADIVKYIIPVAWVVAEAAPQTEPAVAVFAASVKLVQSAVLTAQQRWAADGSAANAQKLADVLEILELPIVMMFAQVGIEVDTAYVTNLINGVVAILNAHPATLLPAKAA